MASNLSVCGVCDYRHITKPSVVWCSECDEGLCEECKGHHGISKGTRHHGIVSITGYQKLPNNVLQLAHFCEKHNEKYQIFCKKHDCLCCKKCIIETHNGCKELTDLDDITRHIKSSNAFAELELTLSELAENVKIIMTNREDNIASIGKQSKNIEKEIQEMRDNINQHLDKVQGAILKELKTKEEEQSNKIRRLLKCLIDKEKEITAHQTNISNIKRYASELQTFLALKNIEKDVAADEHYFQSIVKSDGVNQFELSWKINTALQDMLFDIKKFGDVMVAAEPCNIHYQKQKDKQAQMMVPVKHLIIDSLTPTLLQSFDTKLFFVTGCALLPDCRKVLACSSLKMLRVLNPDNLLEFDIRDFGRVFDVTHIGGDSVAVTSGYENDAIKINLIDLKARQVKKTLRVNSVNTGVAYSEDNLIYCAEKNGIQMISLKDKSIINVTKTNVNKFSCVASFKDNIFYTNCSNNSVTCIDYKGNTRWVFNDASVLSAPFGISIDRDGNVYVVGQDSNNIVVFSPNGQNCRQLLLTSENGLKSPSVVHVDRSSWKIMVANRLGKAVVYSLK